VQAAGVAGQVIEHIGGLDALSLLAKQHTRGPVN
jgi:hypothetical protein